MAMTVPSNNQAQTQTQTAAPAQQQPQQQAQKPQQPQQPQGTRPMNTPFSIRKNRGYSRSSTSEAMRKVLEQLDKIAAAEAVDGVVQYRFIPLDAEKEGLNISAVVVAASLRDPKPDQKHVVFHPLFLGATGRGVKTRERKVAQTSVVYEDLVLPSEAMDVHMIKTISTNLSAAYPGYVQHSAEYTVIPAVMNLDSEEAVRNIASNATTAAWTLLASEVFGAGWVIDRDLKDMRTGLSIKYSDVHFTGLDGLPVRSDVVLELSEISTSGPGSNDWTYNNSQTSELLMQLNGFFDLVYDPVQPQDNLGFGMNNVAVNQEALVTYKPRFVITNVDSPESCDLTLQLLGIAATQALPAGRHHIQAMIEQHRYGERTAQDGVNMRDIGAIGLEVPRMASGIPGTAVPAMERFPTASASFSDESLASIIRTYVSGADMQISLDVPEGGPSSWMTAVFAAAARGDSIARSEIFAAADVLTSNRFTNIYTQMCGGVMQDPVFDDNLIVNLGTYPSQNTLRDIRDIGYLEVLNLTGDTTMDVIKDWSNLQANESVDEHYRAYEARRILHNAFAALQITGRARRVTFNNKFLAALLQAVRDSGLCYELTASKQAPMGTGRLVNSYLGRQSQSTTGAGAFTRTGFSREQGQTNAAGSFGRFAYQNSLNGANY